MEKPNTAVIILNYNSADDTISCIKSIETFNTSPIKYIVVDNGSSKQGEVSKLNAFFSQSEKHYRFIKDNSTIEKTLPYFTFLASSCNDGYAQGNKKGIQLAYNDPSIHYLLILNSDILFVEDLLPSLLEVQQQKEHCGLVTPLVVSEKGTIDHCCARNAPTNWDVILLFFLFRRDAFHILSRANNRQKILLNQPEMINSLAFQVDLPSGACMLVKKNLFKAIEDFDPKTFLYYEENILYKKLMACSCKNYCVPVVRCIHKGAGSTQQQSSFFLQRCNLESANHYLVHYASLSLIQKMFWLITKGLWELKFKLFSH